MIQAIIGLYTYVTVVYNENYCCVIASVMQLFHFSTNDRNN